MALSRKDTPLYVKSQRMVTVSKGLASETVEVKGTSSPSLEVPGVKKFPSGSRFLTKTCVVLMVEVSPSSSVTRSATVKVPSSMYRWVASCVVVLTEKVTPS